LTVAYACQLESADLWTSAVFVLLHLSEENAWVNSQEHFESILTLVKSCTSRQRSIAATCRRFRGWLDRVLGQLAMCAQFVDCWSKGTLDSGRQVGQWLIHHSQAFHHRGNGQVYQEYLASLEAGLFDRAHSVVLDRLASEAILREDMGVLRKLMESLEDQSVSDWENGGGVSGLRGDEDDDWWPVAQILVDYIWVVETAPEVLKNIKSQKRTAEGDLPEDIQFVRDLLASLAVRVGRLWRRGTGGLCDGDVDLQNQAAKTKMVEVIHRFAGLMAVHGKVRICSPCS
jgi:hypothetical protein